MKSFQVRSVRWGNRETNLTNLQEKESKSIDDFQISQWLDLNYTRKKRFLISVRRLAQCFEIILTIC